jgi:hypothetical protein
MTEPLDQRLQLVISKRQISTIDEWRRLQLDLPSRSEAIRRLIEAGLTAKPGANDRGTPGGSAPGSTRKSAASSRTTPKAKPGRSAQPAASSKPLSKEAQLRALREATP